MTTQGKPATPHGIFPHRSKPIPVTLVCESGLDSVALSGSCILLSSVAELAAEHGIAHVPGYDCDVVCTGEPGTISQWNGLRLSADRSYRDFDGEVDTFIVPSLHHQSRSLCDPDLLAWTQQMSARARRTASLCTGIYLLAAAGLLDGRRATTHWAFAEDFQSRFPSVELDAEPIYVRAGDIYTSAGGTAAFDLLVALVEADYGRHVSRLLAQYFVMFLKRPGSQSQFSTQLRCQFAGRDSVRELQAWILDHLDSDLSVDALAERVAMSPRNFRRVFAREVGVTPARYVERARLEAARRMLEEREATVEGVAAACGFATTETMRTTFVRALGINPMAYRSRFASALSGAE